MKRDDFMTLAGAPGPLFRLCNIHARVLLFLIDTGYSL